MVLCRQKYAGNCRSETFKLQTSEKIVIAELRNCGVAELQSCGIVELRNCGATFL